MRLVYAKIYISAASLLAKFYVACFCSYCSFCLPDIGVVTLVIAAVSIEAVVIEKVVVEVVVVVAVVTRFEILNFIAIDKIAVILSQEYMIYNKS